MGNVGQCCSGNQNGGKGRCCSTDRNGINTNKVGAPVGAAPLPSNEMVGVDATPAPGIDMMQEITADCDDGRKEAGKLDDPLAGGDIAAGGSAQGGDKQEHQFVTYEDQSTYTGQVVDGKRQGHGLWQSSTGQYEGQWKADAQHGKGRQTWSDGRVYDGQFDHGRFSGHGRMVWHTQKGLLTYEGQYKDDLKHGSGRFVWADGRTYDGEWQNGKRHGKGMYMNARCERKVGFWVDDKFERWETSNAEQASSTPAA